MKYPIELITNEGITFYYQSYDKKENEAHYVALDELHQTQMKVVEYDGIFIGCLDPKGSFQSIVREEDIKHFDYFDDEELGKAYEV